MIVFRRRLLSAAIVLNAVACAGDGGSRSLSTEPSVTTPSGTVPRFVTAAVGAPGIANPVVSFWAKKGTFKEVFMYYVPRPGRNDSTVFVRFRVRQGSLVNFPNGQPMQNGDSVRITITLSDPAKLIVDFQPSGLLFNSNDPARLKISYRETNEDRDQDGDVDAEDANLTTKLQMWKQDLPAPWLKVGGANDLDLHEVESDVFGFTTYAVAY